MQQPLSATDLARCEDLLRWACDGQADDPAVAAKVAANVDQPLAAIVIAAAKLQPKAQAKLGEGIWWCTERSLRQATPRQVAMLKSSWIRTPDVFDGCCGIGGDAIAMARAIASVGGALTLVDRDPVMMAMAAENFRLNLASDLQPRDFRCEDVASIDLKADSTLHIDPDRRDDSGRKVRPQDYSPGWESVINLCGQVDAAMVKLAPAADIPGPEAGGAIDVDGHRVWISLSGSVREQTFLWGRAVDDAGTVLESALAGGGRSAVAVDSRGRHAVFTSNRLADEKHAMAKSVDRPLQFMVDPDAAIRAAGLTEAFAEQHALATLGGASGFLTSEEPLHTPLVICEPVVWSGTSDDRKLRRTLRSLNAYPWRVKTRGVDTNPNALEKRYRQCGEKPVTLWISRTGRRQYAALSDSSPAVAQ